MILFIFLGQFSFYRITGNFHCTIDSTVEIPDSDDEEPLSTRNTKSIGMKTTEETPSPKVQKKISMETIDGDNN